MHARYDEWIGFIFDHPVPNPTWHWTSDAPAFEASGEDYAVLIEQTFTNSGRDLSRFSDAQVNQGIYFLASPGCSDYMFSLTGSTVLMETRLSAIRSIFILYRDCFQARCTETLSHLDQAGGSALNPTCYMFWDINVLGYLEGTDEETVLADCVFSVLADTLRLPHLACQEAAIHGYGEFWNFYPERVEEAMDAFLATEIRSARLRSYAENARIGYVN